jgi:hypothetical protein
MLFGPVTTSGIDRQASWSILNRHRAPELPQWACSVSRNGDTAEPRYPRS